MTGLDGIARTAAAAGPRDAVAEVAGGEEFNLASNVNYLLRRAHTRADFLFNQVMGEIALTPRQAAILYAAGATPGCSLTDLSRITGIDRGTIAEMVPRLVKRGLLVRTRAPADGRAKALFCTDVGEAAFRFVRDRTPALTDEVLGTLPDEYHPLLIKVLRLFVGLERETRTSTIAVPRAGDGDA